MAHYFLFKYPFLFGTTFQFRSSGQKNHRRMPSGRRTRFGLWVLFPTPRLHAWLPSPSHFYILLPYSPALLLSCLGPEHLSTKMTARQNASQPGKPGSTRPRPPFSFRRRRQLPFFPLRVPICFSIQLSIFTATPLIFTSPLCLGHQALRRIVRVRDYHHTRLEPHALSRKVLSLIFKKNRIRRGSFKTCVRGLIGLKAKDIYSIWTYGRKWRSQI